MEDDNFSDNDDFSDDDYDDEENRDFSNSKIKLCRLNRDTTQAHLPSPTLPPRRGSKRETSSKKQKPLSEEDAAEECLDLSGDAAVSIRLEKSAKAKLPTKKQRNIALRREMLIRVGTMETTSKLETKPHSTAAECLDLSGEVAVSTSLEQSAEALPPLSGKGQSKPAFL